MVVLRGTVQSGVGEGAHFMALDWVRAAVRQAVGFEPYAGTLNLRLPGGDILDEWRRLRANHARLLVPPPASCGGRLVPVLVADEIPAAIVVPDVTRYGDDVLEVVAAIHLRSRLALADGDVVTLRCGGAGHV